MSQPFIPVAGTAKVELVYSAEDQIVENVFYVRDTQGMDEQKMGNIAVNFGSWHDTHGRVHQNQDVILQRIKVTDLTTQNGAGIEYTGFDSPAGAATGTDSVPLNVALCMKWLTGLRGRSFRGRTYHIGLSVGDLVHSRVNQTVLTALIAEYTELIATANTGTGQLVVVSRMANKEWRTAGVTTAITAVTADNVVDSQRRRLPLRGR